MKIEKAIEILQEDKVNIDSHNGYFGRGEHLDIAIKAMEKQIPKKVEEIHVDEYFCPTCGSENPCDDGKIGDKYCPNCGQALEVEQ